MTPTASWNAWAWGPACWPTEASRTSIRSVGLATSAMSLISWIRSASSACRPDVSTMMTSWLASAFMPSATILEALVSPGMPKNWMPTLSRDLLQLVVGGRPVDVAGDQPDLHALLVEVTAQLPGGGGLSLTVEADHHDGLLLDRAMSSGRRGSSPARR